MNSSFIHANYSEQVIEEYKGNPLIEALPPIYSKEEVIGKLSYYPMFDVSEREMESHHRFHLIQRLFNIFQVFPNHLILNDKIGTLIRQGYVGRNPMKPEYARSFSEKLPDIQNDIWINDTSPKSMSCIGIPGAGKSSSITRILNCCYPQVLIHSDYRGNPFSSTQLVWLQLNCPHDGSVKGLVNQFFISIDNILGTDYFNKFGRSNKLSVNTLMPIMTTVCRGINLGFLCIDEVQHLSLKGVGAKLMLNFFVTLSNILSIPICLIGTPSAMNVLQREFRQARRSGQSDMIFNRMENDAYWRLFIETLWNYQWVRKPVDLTDEFVDVLYESSQGILDICLKTYALAQTRSIATGREELSPRLISQVASENLKLVQPMLRALRSGDIHEIAKYEDIYFPYETAIERERIELGKNSFINATKAINNTVSKEQLQEEAVFRLNLLGLSKETAKQMVKSVLKEKTVQDVNELAKLAYQYSLIKVQENTQELKKESSPNLLTIVKEGKEQGLSAYQSLKRAGIIKSLEGVV
ncbi:ATP-binding protein [Bacillus sp. BRMEA1]|uniref:ATP-binding protein n=1 Tax=Neobacillus endophyticus TaxID=2738405 RepID=UPI001566A844|nr:ATP-binding protein [Neobacillus endophyticus]NRD76569.1 ATP-binding protein [Neobacillus endophyticus]